jgi:hypothetical protein
MRHGHLLLGCDGPTSILTGPRPDAVWDWIRRNFRKHRRARSGLHHWIDFDDLLQLLDESQRSRGPGERKSREMVQEIFRRRAEQDLLGKKTVLIEKSPLHAYFVRVILEDHPNAKVVDLVRDCRDVCQSHHALAKRPGGEFARSHTARIVAKWKRCIESVDEVLADETLAERVHRVRFEDLRARPQEELASIHRFAEMPTTEAIVARSIDTFSSRGGNETKGLVGRWRTALGPQDKLLCEALAGRTLRRLGYPPTFALEHRTGPIRPSTT